MNPRTIVHPLGRFSLAAALCAAVVAWSPSATHAADDQPRRAAPPSLDDLLGLEEAADASAIEAERQRQEALRRRLSESEKRDAFMTAVDDMRRTAELLGDLQETGVATQRLQEAIIDRLEMLLRQPPQRNNDSSSSSSPQPQSSSDPQQSPAQPQPEQGGAAEGTGDDATPGDPSPAEATLLEQALEGAGVEWGALPDRVRDQIRQGLRERPSSLYERLTEAYYRRLAEESSR